MLHSFKNNKLSVKQASKVTGGASSGSICDSLYSDWLDAIDSGNHRYAGLLELRMERNGCSF